MLTNPSREHIVHNTLWVVDLNDGRRIYQDDANESSWLDLKRYLYDNRDYYITNMFLQFRDHYESVGYEKDYYFFSKKLLGQFGGINIYSYYVAGISENGKTMVVKHYKIPDLIIDETDVRDISHGQYNRNIIVHPDYLVNFAEDKYFG